MVGETTERRSCRNDYENKLDGTYSFINLTKEHICPCKFESVDDALKDIDEKIKSGEVIRYFELR